MTQTPWAVPANDFQLALGRIQNFRRYRGRRADRQAIVLADNLGQAFRRQTGFLIHVHTAVAKYFRRARAHFVGNQYLDHDSRVS
jgi:hypothetical protein